MVLDPRGSRKPHQGPVRSPGIPSGYSQKYAKIDQKSIKIDPRSIDPTPKSDPNLSSLPRQPRPSRPEVRGVLDPRHPGAKPRGVGGRATPRRGQDPPVGGSGDPGRWDSQNPDPEGPGSLEERSGGVDPDPSGFEVLATRDPCRAGPAGLRSRGDPTRADRRIGRSPRR